MIDPKGDNPQGDAPESERLKSAASAELPNIEASGDSRNPLSPRDLIILALVIVACGAGMWYFLTRSNLIMGSVEVSIHGWVAMGLGVMFSLIVGTGLMWLVFFSARHGFDDRIDHDRR